MNICVCLHLYYLDMIPEMKEYLDNIPEYDLYITTPEENRVREQEIRAALGDAVIIYTENVGFDVYPFVRFLETVPLEQYDLVYKLHTKKDIPIEYSLNGYDLKDGKWRYYLLDSILGGQDKVRQIMEAFEKDPSLGMMGSKELIIRDEDIDKDIDMEKVKAVMQELGLSVVKREFIAGSMFVIRSSLLEPLKRRNFRQEEFPPYLPRDWNGLPYCLERCFGCMVSAQGYRLKGVYARSTMEDKSLWLKKEVQDRLPGPYRMLQKLTHRKK